MSNFEVLVSLIILLFLSFGFSWLMEWCRHPF